jgi:CO/xanthine dehydrogenase FAD-binding subunit
MKPAPFAYHRPGSVEEALALLSEHGDDARPLAGGQSLIPAMNFRLATPAVLIDLNDVSELTHIGMDAEGGLRVGAMTRQRALERSPLIARAAPLIAETMPYVAHAAIRSRGTIGGSLAHADPAAELPAVMLAHEARFRLLRQRGDRWVPASEFFTGLFSTALEPGELLVEVAVPPMPSSSGWAFLEISRRHGDFALAGVAVLAALDGRGQCAGLRVALLSVGDRPILSAGAAKALIGQRPSAESIRAAAAAAAGDIDPTSDIHASSGYRRQLAAVLTRRALETAFRRAAAGPPME